MAQVGRWSTLVGIALGALGACIWLANTFLPWDAQTNVSAGGAAGAVVDGFLVAWAASVGSSVDSAGASVFSNPPSGSGPGISSRQEGPEKPGRRQSPLRSPRVGTVVPASITPASGSHPKGASERGVRDDTPRLLVRVGQIPREPPGYQPRTDLLGQLSVPEHRGLSMVHVLTGLRGVGKTQLAAAYARARIVEGWPVVAWLTGEDRHQVLAGLAALAQELHVSLPDDDDTVAARRARTWLESSTRPNLLVIDNVHDPADVLEWLPAGGRTHILMTTTNQAFGNTAVTVDVTVYAPDQAVAYLTGTTGLTDLAGARALAAELGYLPLALAQTAWRIVTGLG